MSTDEAGQMPDRRSWVAVLPALGYAVLVLPFVYQDVVGEPDLCRMAYAMLYGQATAFHEAARYHYGYSFSFGYYAAFYNFAPDSVLSNSAALIAAMNLTGYCSAVVAIALLGLYTARLFGVLTATVIAIIFASSPLFLELGTSGHPTLPALSLLLLGAWLLTFVTDGAFNGFVRTVMALGAVVAITVAICVRADIALVLPFVAIAGKAERKTVRECLPDAALRCALLALALVGFFGLQAAVLMSSQSAMSHVGSFLFTFEVYDPKQIPKGLAFLTLGTGIASILCAITMGTLRTVRRLTPVEALAIGALAIPSIVLWLPIYGSVRHFLPVSLAVAIAIAVMLARSVSSRWVMALAILMPMANQVCAEASYPFIAQHYAWSFPQFGERRSTYFVPIGAFASNHRANQALFSHFRHEGKALARACDGPLLVFADTPYYFLLSLAEHDKMVRFNEIDEFGLTVIRAVGKACEAHVIVKFGAWPRDVVPDFLNSAKYKHWRVYFQEVTRGRHDKTVIPGDRLLSIDLQ